MADRQQHDTRTTRRPDCVTEIRMGNSVLVVSGYFKKDTTTTAADKMARVLEAGVVLLVICHRQYSFQSVISFFMLSIFRLAVSCRKLSPVKRTGTHMESRRS